MSNAEQLERETEQTRAQIADTLDELRACMTPGHVLDQLADRMRDGAPASFARNLKDQAVNNPLPVALIGAGLAWLMLSPRGADGSFFRRSGERLRDAASGASENVRDAVDRAGRAASAQGVEWNERASGLGEDAREGLASTAERAKQAGRDATNSVAETAASMTDDARRRAARAADSFRDSAGAMSDSMQRTASAGYDAIADSTRRAAQTVSESTKAAGQRTLQSGSAFLDFCREQPLVLAGLGLAAGAIIGTLLPTSETEDEFMGETSDRVKERAQDLASEQYEGAKKVGERALDAAKDEAVKQANERAKTDDPESAKEASAGELKADRVTLVPSDHSELETRGQPWTADNAPV